MKIAFISDIHSNVQALTTALRAIDEFDVDGIYCLGDVVGYGADPGPCIDLVREKCAATVLGNHDLAVATGQGEANLPRSGRVAAQHNRNLLDEDQLQFLRELPLMVEVGPCTLVHATPKEPDAWVRFDDIANVRDQFAYFDTPFCFVGHTHVPGIAADKLGVFRIKDGVRYILNAGSVGQPRDNNPQLGFLIFDTDERSHEIVRRRYDVTGAAQRIEEERLPRDLASRLFRGK